MNTALESWNKHIGIEIEELNNEVIDLTEHAIPVLALEEVDTLPSDNTVIKQDETSFDDWMKTSLEESSIIIDTPDQEDPKPDKYYYLDQAPTYDPKPKKFNTDALDKWVAQQGRMSNWAKVAWVCFGFLAIGVLILTLMVRNADAGMAFMRFEVFSVTEKTIIVMDEHEDFFTFYKEGSPDVKKGDVVIVCTDLTYINPDKWEWNRKRTSIIDVMEGGDENEKSVQSQP